MKYSISNLAWGHTPLDQIIPKLANAGLHGVEIAPTAIWPDLNQVSDQEIIEFKEYLEGHNLIVSGIQSLLYGHPELQLFDQNCWKDLRMHLEKFIRIGGLLRADVAVFGSPKNRVKGSLDCNDADDLAAIFLKQLIPCLEQNSIVLTLEPNAPNYGADYLTTYEDTLRLSQRINSENIRPQIDTGCLWMVGEEPIKAFEILIPHHIHISTPNLGDVPGNWDFDGLFEKIKASDYSGWLVIEKLSNSIADSLSSGRWLQFEMGAKN